MPTAEEMCAILSLANKAHNAYGNLYDTENQYQIVMNWGRKWFDTRDKVRKNAKKYMQERRKINKDYGHKKKEK